MQTVADYFRKMEMPAMDFGPDPEYWVCAYVKNHGGYFKYSVGTVEQAMHHAVAIMKDGVYRQQIQGGVQVWPVYKVKATGPGLESEYEDEFVWT